MLPEFVPYQKIARLSRDIVVTEKIDGTNGQIYIDPNGAIYAGSRNHWLIDTDNFGFAKWVNANADRLRMLGPGRYYGEWAGAGVGRRYGMSKKKFVFFRRPEQFDLLVDGEDDVDVVPELYSGMFCEQEILQCLERLRCNGSVFAPGFMKPEGIVIFHTASGTLFKKTLERDHEFKGIDRLAE